MNFCVCGSGTAVVWWKWQSMEWVWNRFPVGETQAHWRGARANQEGLWAASHILYKVAWSNDTKKQKQNKQKNLDSPKRQSLQKRFSWIKLLFEWTLLPFSILLQADGVVLVGPTRKFHQETANNNTTKQRVARQTPLTPDQWWWSLVFVRSSVSPRAFLSWRFFSTKMSKTWDWNVHNWCKLARRCGAKKRREERQLIEWPWVLTKILCCPHHLPIKVSWNFL